MAAQATNAQNIDYARPGAGAEGYNVAVSNVAKKMERLWKHRNEKKGGSKELWEAMVKNTKCSLARSPNSAISKQFDAYLKTGKMPAQVTPHFLKYSVDMFDYGLRSIGHRQQNKSNFLDSVFGKILTTIATVAAGIAVPGWGGIALGSAIGGLATAASTRPSGFGIATGVIGGGLGAHAGSNIATGIQSAGGVGNYVNNGLTSVGNFIRHPIATITGNGVTAGSAGWTAAGAGNTALGLSGDALGPIGASGAGGVAAGGASIPTIGAGSLGLTGSALGPIGTSGAGGVVGAVGRTFDASGNLISGGGGGMRGLGWGDVLQAGTSIVGTLFDNKTNDNSADAIRLATEADRVARAEARRDLERGYQRVEKINRPGVKAYGDAVGVLNPLLTTGKVKVGNRTLSVDEWMQQVDPGYKFRLAEGGKAASSIQRSRGDRLSGRAQKELVRYGQGFASNEFGASVNRLHNLASLGDQAVGRVSNAAVGQGSNNAALTLQGGEVSADSILARSGLDAASRNNWSSGGVGSSNHRGL